MRLTKAFVDELNLSGRHYTIVGVKTEKNEEKLILPIFIAHKVLWSKLKSLIAGPRLNTDKILFVSGDKFGELLAHPEIELYSWMRL